MPASPIVFSAPFVGFSTGALARGNYVKALSWLSRSCIPVVELCALRFAELAPLVADLDNLVLDDFTHVSFHAPSSFPADKEAEVVALLAPVLARGWNIVVHPDVICTPALWRPFGRQLLLENMDSRKSVARTLSEMQTQFDLFPEAGMCLDAAHARHLDSSLGLLRDFLRVFRDRIREIHLSEIDENCQHLPMAFSYRDYRSIDWDLQVPVVIESVFPTGDDDFRWREFIRARRIFAAKG